VSVGSGFCIRFACSGWRYSYPLHPLGEASAAGVCWAKSRVTRSLTTEECQQYLHVEQCPGE